MKEIAYLLSIVIVMTAAVATEASEAKCREIARREYPNDAQMQQFTYNQQVAAYRYMQSVRDADVKAIAVREYHEDFAMQKFTYDQQSAAKRYMTTVRDAQVKQIALREYPHDYAMQKFTYDQQLAAKNYMATVRDAEINVQTPCEPLGGRPSDKQRAGQPRAPGGGNGVNILPGDVGLRERLGDDSGQELNVTARGDFGDDPPMGAMLNLRMHYVGEDRAAVLHDGGRGFIAGGFNAENDHGG
jgi:hypothetical protein